MKTPASLLPQSATLTERLTAALKDNTDFPAPLAVLNRRLPPMMSTFPNEAITCRFANGRRRRLFVKYEADRNHDSFGHRGGVRYEARVYAHFLQDYPGFRPRFLGAHSDSRTGESWLVLEFLDRCVRVIDISVKDPCHEPVAMLESARWIARFHASREALPFNGVHSFLKHYDEKYFRGWSVRTAELTRSLHKLHPWVPELCKKDDWISLLLNATFTVIHGEFYGKTLLFKNDTVFPIDWESAAFAAGEIDLAALTEGNRWPEQVVQRCLREYQQTRWPNGTPADFHQTLDAARLYLHFRWLGEREDWTLNPKAFWRYEHMRAAAERLGLL